MHRPRLPKTLATVVQIVTPVFVSAILVVSLLIALNTSRELKRQARVAALGACNATHQSDVAFDSFLRKQIASGSRAQDPETLKFLDDLEDSTEDVYAMCLAAIH